MPLISPLMPVACKNYCKNKLTLSQCIIKVGFFDKIEDVTYVNGLGKLLRGGSDDISV